MSWRFWLIRRGRFTCGVVVAIAVTVALVGVLADRACSPRFVHVRLDPPPYENPAPILANYCAPCTRAPEVRPEPFAPETPAPRVVLLGLDGADWGMIEPMMDAGMLPRLHRLMAGGTIGVLKTDVGISPISWTTIATGKSADRHGIDGELVAGSILAWERADRLPSDLKVRTIWEIVGQQGLSTAVYRYFFASHESPWTWHGVAAPRPAFQGTGPPANQLDETTQETLALRTDAAAMRDHPANLNVMYYKATDNEAHVAMLDWWRRWHPEYFASVDAPADSGTGDRVTAVWREVDATLPEYWRARSAGGYLVICSDHGFGAPIHTPLVARLTGPAAALLLLPTNERRTEADRRDLRDIAVTTRWLNDDVAAFRMRHKNTPETFRFQREEVTLTAKTLRGRQALADRMGFVRYLLAGADSLEIECQPPDRLVVRPRLEPLKAAIWGEYPTGDQRLVDVTFHPGTHGPTDPGVLLLAGPGIRAGAVVDGARLVDITPTILYLLDLPVARDMDGRVLSEAFEPWFLAARPVRWTETYETTPPTREKTSLQAVVPAGPDEESLRRRQLRALGYIN